MKLIFFVAIVASIFNSSFAKDSSDDQIDGLAKTVSDKIGLTNQDTRYPMALTNCALNDQKVTDQLDALLDAMSDHEFQRLSDVEKETRLTVVRIGIKGMCRNEIKKAGIRKGKPKSK